MPIEVTVFIHCCPTVFPKSLLPMCLGKCGNTLKMILPIHACLSDSMIFSCIKLVPSFKSRRLILGGPSHYHKVSHFQIKMLFVSIYICDQCVDTGLSVVIFTKQYPIRLEHSRRQWLLHDFPGCMAQGSGYDVCSISASPKCNFPYVVIMYLQFLCCLCGICEMLLYLYIHPVLFFS